MLLIVRALCTSDILTSIHVRRNYSRCSVPRCLFSLFMTQLFRNFSRLTLNKNKKIKKYNKIKIYTQCNLFFVLARITCHIMELPSRQNSRKYGMLEKKKFTEKSFFFQKKKKKVSLCFTERSCCFTDDSNERSLIRTLVYTCSARFRASYTTFSLRLSSPFRYK